MYLNQRSRKPLVINFLVFYKAETDLIGFDSISNSKKENNQLSLFFNFEKRIIVFETVKSREKIN